MKTKRVKNKRDVRAKYTLSDKQLKKIKADVTAEAVTKTGMLYLVALAEKGWGEDDIVDLFETISRYTKYIVVRDANLILFRNINTALNVG